MKDLFKDKLVSVILFGSYARGDYNNESDIDIMVIVDIPKDELIGYRQNVSIFANYLDLKFNFIISIKLQDKYTYECWKDTLPFFKAIKEEGIIINA